MVPKLANSMYTRGMLELQPACKVFSAECMLTASLANLADDGLLDSPVVPSALMSNTSSTFNHVFAAA